MPTITTTNCRSPGGTYAPFDSADSNNFQTLLIKYVQLNSFRSGTVTTTAILPETSFVALCVSRKTTGAISRSSTGPAGNPWKISYAMSQYTLRGASLVTSPKTAKLASLPNPAQTLGTEDVSLNQSPGRNPAGQNNDGNWDIGSANMATGTLWAGRTRSSSTATWARFQPRQQTASSWTLEIVPPRGSPASHRAVCAGRRALWRTSARLA